MNVLIHNALVVDGTNPPHCGWLLTSGAFIDSMGESDFRGDIPVGTEVVDARGCLLMPGAIDCHVHFREPGLEAKATIASESRAAVAGGVTSFIDMPNTIPQTTTIAAWEDKMARAERSSAANYAFMMGATADNLAELLAAPAHLMPAVKVFMGSSTGGMLLDEPHALASVFEAQGARIVVHAEDQSIINANIRAAEPITDPDNMLWHSRLRNAEACVRATEHAMELTTRYGSRLHVAHVTTEAETRLFDPAQSPVGKQITAEVSPHHLLWTVEDYARLGSRIKMNPAVKTATDRAALRDALATGRLDIIATDHAPHRLADKQGDVFHAASGAPMVQFSLPTMLDLYDPATVAWRYAGAPAALFGIDRRGLLRPGYYADMVIVERLDTPHIVSDADVVSLCGWTPMAGSSLSHRIVATYVNGGTSPLPLNFKQ